MGIAGRGRSLIDIAHIDHGLRGEQFERLEGGALLVGDFGRAGRACPRATAAERARPARASSSPPCPGRAASSRACGMPPLEAVEIGEHQLGLDGFGVVDRIDAALDMDDVVVLEAAQHIGDGVDLADMRRGTGCRALRPWRRRAPARRCRRRSAAWRSLERIWRSLRACRGAGREPAPRRHSARWCRTDNWRPRRGALGQRVEQGGLADIGQSDDAAFESHGQYAYHEPSQRRSLLARRPSAARASCLTSALGSLRRCAGLSPSSGSDCTACATRD